MTPQLKNLALQLIDEGAVLVKRPGIPFPAFPIADSPIYLDLHPNSHFRGGPIRPLLARALGEALYTLIREKASFGILVGLYETGAWLAQQIVDAQHSDAYKGLHFFASQSHPNVARSQPPTLQPTQHALAVCGVPRTGTSTLQEIERLQKAGLIVDAIIMVVDRKEGGSEKFHQAGYAVDALFTLNELVELYFAENWICQAVADQIPTT